MTKITKAVIPAAGYGTRFLPITKGVSKEMINIIDKPAIQYIIEEAIDSGVKDIVIVVNREKEAIKNYFSKSEIYDNLKDRTLLQSVDKIMDSAKISFVLQETMRGNGDAVLVTKSKIGDEPFAVMFGDDVIYNNGIPAIEQLVLAYEKVGTCILGVQRCAPEIACRSGVVRPGQTEGRFTEVLDIEEKPPIDKLPSDLVSLGRFILTPDIFEELKKAPLLKNEIYLTIALRSLMKKKGGYAYEFEGRRYDIGNKFGYCQANVEYGLRNTEFGKEFGEYLKEITK